MAWRGVAGPGEARQGKGTRLAGIKAQALDWFIPKGNLARRGKARHGPARLGKARHGQARRGKAR